jgi:hypothetical protein
MEARKSHWSREECYSAREYAVFNRETIESSAVVGCYCCKSVGVANDIIDYIEEADGRSDTALCGFCGIDAVIGDSTGYPVHEKNFLDHLHWYAFDHVTLSNGCVTTTTRPTCLWCVFAEDDATSEYVYPDTTFDIASIEITCDMCPFQLEGETSDGRSVFVRERCGTLRIDIDGMTVYKKRKLEGFCGYEDLLELTREWFNWPPSSDSTR